MGDAGTGTENGAEKAGFGVAALSAGGEGEESYQCTAADGAAGAACTGGGDRGKDGGEPFGDLRHGRAGAKKHHHAEDVVARGGGDGMQAGVRDCAERRQEAGGFGGREAVDGVVESDDRGQ